jgi:hypothetical protein
LIFLWKHVLYPARALFYKTIIIDLKNKIRTIDLAAFKSIGATNKRSVN